MHAEASEKNVDIVTIAVAGGVGLLCIVGVIIVIALLVHCCKRKKNTNEQRRPPRQPHQAADDGYEIPHYVGRDEGPQYDAIQLDERHSPGHLDQLDTAANDYAYVTMPGMKIHRYDDIRHYRQQPPDVEEARYIDPADIRYTNAVE